MLLISSGNRNLHCYVYLQLVDRQKFHPVVPVEFRVTLDGVEAFAVLGLPEPGPPPKVDGVDYPIMKIEAIANKPVFHQVRGFANSC